MAIRLSKFVQRILPTPVAGEAGNVVAVDYFFDVPVGQIVANDIIDIGTLPAYNTVSDAILIADQLDSGGSATLTLDVGILSGEPGSTDASRTVGTELFAASTAAQTGTPARATQKSAFTIKPTEADRSIGVKFAAAAATAAAGRIRLRLFIHAADHTTQF